MQNKIMMSEKKPRFGHIQFTSYASSPGVGLHPCTLGWFTSTPSTGAPSDWVSQDDKKSCGQWGVMKKKQTVRKLSHPPTNTALRQHCTLLLGAAFLPIPISQHNLWPYSPPDRRSFWQSYPQTSSGLHKQWSMKHAIRQKWDAEILNVNTHQTQLSLNYTAVTSAHCLKCATVFPLW